mmetsp:Transcript_18367/g.63238  ORF Transcript_18367/g.63238 Transcript_18367/m.63238 type:complete len:171 (+) Transcript_18367:1590-2102(+)
MMISLIEFARKDYEKARKLDAEVLQQHNAYWVAKREATRAEGFRKLVGEYVDTLRYWDMREARKLNMREVEKELRRVSGKIAVAAPEDAEAARRANRSIRRAPSDGRRRPGRLRARFRSRAPATRHDGPSPAGSSAARRRVPRRDAHRVRRKDHVRQRQHGALLDRRPRA